MLNLTNLQKMIDEKYISVQKHPKLDYFIYNYTQKAQFDRVWNDETLQCRGLIMDSEHNIIARPFPKFFNLQEHIDQGGQLPATDFVVTEKMDGSLGISYFDTDDQMFLATRGSFTSEQASMGTQILHERYRELHWNPAYTYLFEIVYPDNRIVVDYRGLKDIVLLSVIDTYTGEEFPYEKLQEWYGKTSLQIVRKYDGVTDFTKLEERPNAEGYVIAFPSTKQRFKVKFDEYVRLHRLVTGVNARTIWDLLRNGQDFEELLDKVPDEFYYWVKKTRQDLTDRFLEIQFDAHQRMLVLTLELGLTFGDGSGNDVDRGSPGIRKHFASKAVRYKYPGILFAMYDNKPYKEMIWKMLKPKAEKPFREEI